MICPKCGFEQPENPECMRCGIIVSRYKGAIPSAAPVPPPAPASYPPPPPPGYGYQATPPPPPDPMMSSDATVFSGPVPAFAGGGTVYGGPPPAPVQGTVYGGPPPGMAAPTFGAPRAFHGTFEIGKVLSETFTIYFRNIIPFVLLTTLAMAPLLLLTGWMTSSDFQPEAIGTGQLLLTLVPVFLGAILCPYIATSAITYGVFQQMRGRDVSIGDCFSRGLSSLLPVLGVAIVQGICIMLGFIACIVPGILLALRWAVSVPAAVEERQGIGEAMSRSTYLTEGFRAEIFAVLFVLGFINIGATFGVTAFMAAEETGTLFVVLSSLKDLLFVGISATATAVMYYRLRSVKESLDVDQIASVFA